MVVYLLTGCYNRNKFSESMRDFMRIARETGEPFSVVMLDIDHFKRINDTYGHDAGDEVLVNFVQTIRPHLDRRHVLIRWGAGRGLCRYDPRLGCRCASTSNRTYYVQRRGWCLVPHGGGFSGTAGKARRYSTLCGQAEWTKLCHLRA